MKVGIGTGMKGFTLIELMIVVVVVAILASIAIPAYSEYVRRSYRTDATTALLRIQSAQEKYYLNQNTYADTIAKLNITGTENGFYALAITAGNATTYTATATAQGPQLADDACRTFTVTAQGARTATDSGGADNSAECWD